jgi:PleD family two-component response regulator
MTASRHTTDGDTQPLVLLIEPKRARHQHQESVARAGFRVASLAADDVEIARIVEQCPAVVAAELDGSRSRTLNLARRFRQIPETRLIPFLIYGHKLPPRDIEDAARAGALWLQLEPTDGARLVAAVRGLVAASRRDRS